jgi:hypothetical protein
VLKVERGFRPFGDSTGQDLIEYAFLGGFICLTVATAVVTFGPLLQVPSPPDDPVALFVRDKMKPASGALFVPSPLERERASEVVLEIAPPDIDPKRLELELQERASEEGLTASASIRIASRMVANLVADRAAMITPKDKLDRALTFGERARWRWSVVPQAGSTLTLTATLTAPVIVDGKETGYQVKSFEKTVTVNVTRSQQLTDALAWLDRNKWPLGLAGSALAVFAAWIRRRSFRIPGQGKLVEPLRSIQPPEESKNTPETVLGTEDASKARNGG